jgi:hypothetical protein
MSLANIVRSGVAIANKVTASLQGTVTIKQWVAQDGFGLDTFGKTLRIPAIIEMGEKEFDLQDGVSITTKATITFLQPVPVNGAAGRVEPIDTRDILTLPDGTTGPTLVGAPMIVDPASSKPYFQIVGIGK